MLKRVTTEQDLAYYNFIWMTAWREKGYDFEFLLFALVAGSS